MSLRTTLVAAIAYVLVLAIVVLEVPLVINLSRRVDAEIKAEAAGQAQIVATTAGDRFREPPNRLQPLVDQAARDLGGRVLLLDRSGDVIVDSAGTGLRGASYADRPEVASALAGEISQGERRSDSLDEDLLATAVPVTRNARTNGAVRVTQSVSAVNDEVRNDTLGLIGVGVAALALGLGAAWVLAGFLARPPRSLAAAARRVTAGDLEARAPERGPREQREVARAFNEMTERVANVLAAQRDFVANASHQLRTPLTGLRLRLEAAADATDDPGVSDDLRAAEDEVLRLARLIDNLLTLASEGEAATEGRPVDLARAARAALERWEAEASERRQRIELSPPPGPAAALGSADELGIVLDNLIENASKYSPPGTEIGLAWGSAEGDPRTVFVAVADRGPGLASGEEHAALDRFYRGSAGASSSGTGLGLAIVDALARRRGGAVELRNRPGGGLIAVVSLPAATFAAGSLPTPDPELDRSLPRPS